LNLRAALYRALTELKKNGVLGKEIVLRKTMLDECKGEKFEEVISAFAMAVLRRTARAKNDARLELAFSDHLSGQQQAQLLPLIIALRSSLQQQLSQRHKFQGQAEVYAGLLAQHQASIKNRRALLSRLPMLEDRLKATGPEDIADSWVGDGRWAEILVSGPTRSEDRFLKAPFEEGWEAVLDGKNINMGHQTDLLEDLNAKIAKQEIRLRKWKTFAASLQNRQAQTAKAPRVPTSSEEYSSALLHFDKHQSLQLCSKPIQARSEEQPVPTAPIHETLLASMEAELASLDRRNLAKPSTFRGRQGNKRRTFIENEETTGERPEDLHGLPGRAFKPSPLQPTFVPPSPSGEELSVPEKGLYKEKSASHGEPISIISPEVEREPLGFSMLMNLPAPEDSWEKVEDVQSHDAHVPAHSAAHPTMLGREQSSVTDVIAPEALSLQKKQNKHRTLPSSSGLLVTPDTSTLFAAAHDNHKEEGKTELFASGSRGIRAKQELKSTIIDQPSPRTMAPPPTLLERTRQSMSLLPNSVARAGRRSSEKRASSKQTQLFQAFPVNQFETPRKVRASETSPLETNVPLSGSSTPRDELFSDAAAYDSVFKSRPRIALSPALSPDKSGIGIDSMLEDDLACLTLEGNV
jgi:hypothetical protein